jgi:hypothetical protein
VVTPSLTPDSIDHQASIAASRAAALARTASPAIATKKPGSRLRIAVPSADQSWPRNCIATAITVATRKMPISDR